MGFGFWKHFGERHAQKGLDALGQALINFDPTTASAAQIDEMEEHLKGQSLKLAEVRGDYQREKGEAEAARKHYEIRLKAAENLTAKAAAAEGETKANLEKSLEKLLAELEEQQSEVDREESEAKDAKDLLDELTEGLEEFAKTLRDARGQLKKAETQVKKAEVERERALHKEEQAAVVSGLKKGNQRFDTALQAMKAKAAELQKEAEAAEIRTKAVSKPADVDENIAAAIREASGEADANIKPSTQDRLARLKRAANG